jgi:hypothetical protein
MWNTPTSDLLSKIPMLHTTENIPLPSKIIHAHFFIGGCDWYIAESDGEDLMFGFAILNGDYKNAEWGYISLDELKALSINGIEVDFDLNWSPCPANQVRAICLAQGWPIHTLPVTL